MTRETGTGTGNNGWDEHKRQVLSELKDLKTGQGAVNESLGDIRVAIGQLQVKAGIWGLAAGSIPVTVALGAYYIKGLMGG